MFNRFRSIPTVLPVLFVIIATIIIILLGRGYRLDFRKKNLKPTGLLVAKSDPDGASVFVDGELKTATDNTINIDPDWYTVKIVKEGYFPWEKKLRVQGEVVTNTNAFLFRTNPSLAPLTSNGIVNPIISPDGTKLAYIVPPPDKDDQNGHSLEKSGLWILTMTDRSLGFNRDPRLIASYTLLPPGDLKLLWSPDSSQIIALSSIKTILFDIDKKDSFLNVTANLINIENEWKIQNQKIIETQQALLPEMFLNIATSSASIIKFSPDEDKVFYEATASATIPQVITPHLIGTNPTQEQRNISKGAFYVYDIEEDKNYYVFKRSEFGEFEQDTITFLNKDIDKFYKAFKPEYIPILWFPTSRHFVVTYPDKIDIMEYDRTNWITVYSGPHETGFVVPWPDSSRLVILTNLNTNASKLPNLYSVNLR